MQGVIAGVTQRFATQARDLLESLRKTESSLKRLKKSRAGDAASDGPGALSDADKVNVQLFLDAQVRLSSLDSWHPLGMIETSDGRVSSYYLSTKMW